MLKEKRMNKKLGLAIVLFIALLVSTRSLAQQFFNQEKSGISASEGITAKSNKSSYSLEEEILLTVKDSPSDATMKSYESVNEAGQNVNTLLNNAVTIQLPEGLTYDSVKTVQLNDGVEGRDIKWTEKDNLVTIVQDESVKNREVQISVHASKSGDFLLKIGRELAGKQVDAKELSFTVVEPKSDVTDNQSTDAVDNGSDTAESLEQDEYGIRSQEIPTVRAAATVTTWAEFLAAINDTTVDTINLGASITKSGAAPSSIGRALTINGNSNTLTFDSTSGFVLGTSAVTNKLVINDLQIVKPGTASMITSTSGLNWEVTLNSVTTTSSNTARIASVASADIFLSGINSFRTTTAIAFAGRNINMSGNNTINATTGTPFSMSGDIFVAGELNVTANLAATTSVFTTSGNITMDGVSVINAGSTGSLTQTANNFTLLGSLKYTNDKYLANGGLSINGTFTVDGGVLEFDTYSAGINAPQVLITNNSQVTGKAIYNCFRSRVAGSKFIVNGGSKVNFYSKQSSAIALLAASNELRISGKDTLLDVTGDTNDTDDLSTNGGVIVAQGEASQFNVLDTAMLKVAATNSSASAMILESKGGSFNVDNSSTLVINQKTSGTNALAAALRFKIQGDMTFNVTNNSNIEVNSMGGAAAAIRLFGVGNAVNVASGSQMKVYNAGTGTPINPGIQNANQAVLFLGGTASATAFQSFSLTGERSSISLNAPYGAALDNNVGYVKITAEEGTSFEAKGQTLTAAGAVFNSPRADITVSSPLYYDFVNNRLGGGNVFSASNTSSNFESSISDLSVWKKGANVSGNPFRAWSLITYALGGSNFTSIRSTDVPTEFNTAADSYGTSGMTAYTRMSGNNARAIVDELRIPTNADQTIYGHVSVPEGLNDAMRDAWTDEVYVVIERTKLDGTKEEYQATTVGVDETSTGLAPWGESARAGMFAYKLPNDEFLQAGETLKVTKAWRGGADSSSSRVHASLPQDLIAPERTVIDVTPPEVANITDKDKITNVTKVYEGTGAEVGALVTATLNDQPIFEKDGTTIVQDMVDSAGNWTLTFPDEFVSGDVVRVYLSDHSGGLQTLEATEVKQPSWNATGNINPRDGYDFHDVTFESATKVDLFEAEPKVEFEKTALSLTTGLPVDRIVPGQSLKYRLTIKNSIADSKLNNLVITDNLPSELETPTNGTMVNAKGETAGSVTLAAGKVTATATANQTMLYNDEYTIEFDVKVKANTALGTKILNVASLAGISGNGAAISATSTQTETTTMEGVLKLIEAPLNVDFGKHQISSVNQLYTPSSSMDFKVDDSRISIKNWNLTAKLVDSAVVSEVDGRVNLPNALIFRNKNSDLVLSQNAVQIADSGKMTAKEGITDFGWQPQDTDGLRLSIDAGDILAKEYKWKIEWGLVDAP